MRYIPYLPPCACLGFPKHSALGFLSSCSLWCTIHRCERNDKTMISCALFASNNVRRYEEPPRGCPFQPGRAVPGVRQRGWLRRGELVNQPGISRCCFFGAAFAASLLMLVLLALSMLLLVLSMLVLSMLVLVLLLSSYFFVRAK